eukprot:scaffold577_cov124-Skeletonema_menzelii.AAC.1
MLNCCVFWCDFRFRESFCVVTSQKHIWTSQLLPPLSELFEDAYSSSSSSSSQTRLTTRIRVGGSAGGRSSGGRKRPLSNNNGNNNNMRQGSRRRKNSNSAAAPPSPLPSALSAEVIKRRKEIKDSYARRVNVLSGQRRGIVYGQDKQVYEEAEQLYGGWLNRKMIENRAAYIRGLSRIRSQSNRTISGVSNVQYTNH